VRVNPRARSLAPTSFAFLRVDAESCFRLALDVAARQAAPSLGLRPAMSRSRLNQRRCQLAEPGQRLAQAYGGFAEGFDTLDLQEAKALLEEFA
jgi:adenylate cyclase